MNKGPVDEMYDNEYTVDEEQRQIALNQVQAMNEDLIETKAAVSAADGDDPQPTPESKTTTQPKKEEKKEEPEESDTLQTIGEFGAAIPAGVVDFGIGTTNFVTSPLRQIGVQEIPMLPKFESKEAQFVRDLSSIVVPSLALGAAGTSLGVAAKARYASKLGVLGKLGKDVAFQRFSKVGLAAGTGAFVDYVVPTSETDDNLPGVVKELWPEYSGWISDDIATLDTDSPDVKRAKNVKSGVLLSVGADLLVGAAMLKRNRSKTVKSAEWVPENEMAKPVTDELNNLPKPSTPEEAITMEASKRVDQLEDLGAYNATKSVDLDTPVFGLHDLYDDMEYGMRVRDDGGVLAASTDLVKIEKNIDTVYGRIGSVFTPAALQYGLDADDGAIKLIQDMGDELTEAGRYGYRTSNGKYLSHAQINESGERLAADLLNMDVSTMKRVLAPLTDVDKETGASVLTSEGYAGVFKAINKYLKEYASMDQTKAYAYASASLGGQVSDLAEGARLMDGSNAVLRAQDQILDRIEFLMKAKAQTSYVRGRALNMLNLWRRTKQFTGDRLTDLGLMAKAAEEETPNAMNKAAQEAKQTVDTLRAVSKQRPEMLGPLMLAYEMTDGNINTISKLNEYIKNSTGIASKAFFDANPDMPSAYTQGVWSNIYNSTLSSLVTPLKAGASNSVLLIERPLATFMGAALHGDKKTIRRALYQYKAFGDTFRSAWSHMNEVFKRAAKDPTEVGYVMRDDIAKKNAQQMEVLNAYADAQEQLGNSGPAAMVAHIEELNAISEHPWLRFGSNAMTAFDGFTRSVIGSVEARGRAFDMVNASEGRLRQDMMDDIAKNTYNQMFDKNGMITDKAVEHASREIAMNLDVRGVSSLNELLRDAPAFKPFLMFPRTSMNMLMFAGSHNPLGLLPAKRFQESLHKFSKPFEQMQRQQVEDLLTSRGIQFDDSNIEIMYNNIRAELKGRKAVGALAVLSAGTMFMANGIRGNGHYDKEVQRVRRDAEWKPRTYKGIDGRWYSYDNLGAITDWLALTADVMDNVVDGTLSPNDGQAMFNKLGFILSSSVTSKSFMAGLEPMNDVFAGNPAALSRWASTFSSSLVPMSGFRNDLSRLMTPQLKELDQELIQLIANRNPGMKDGLPDVYDYIDGGLVGVPDNWTRIWNTYSPWKVSDDIGPEKQFLIDIEFDGRPTLTTNGNGVKLTPAQRSAVAQKMGQQKYYLRRIKEIMNSRDGKEFRRRFRLAQQANSEVDVKDFEYIHNRLNDALRDSVNFAIDSLDFDMRNEIREQEYQQNMVQSASQRGDIEALRQYNNY